jgi:hypothetical protein
VKLVLKPPGTKGLNAKHDKLLSNFGFNFNLRRYTMGAVVAGPNTDTRRLLFALFNRT